MRLSRNTNFIMLSLAKMVGAVENCIFTVIRVIQDTYTPDMLYENLSLAGSYVRDVDLCELFDKR